MPPAKTHNPEPITPKPAEPFSAAPPYVPPHRSWWPQTGTGASRTFLILGLVVALFGGFAAFHAEGFGIGLALTGIGLTAVPLSVAGRKLRPTRATGAAVVMLLWAVAAIRDAGWIVTICVMAALLLTPMVLAPPHRFTGVARAAVGQLAGLADGARWVTRGLSRLSRKEDGIRHLRTIGITVGLLVVFGGLFASADEGFEELLRTLLPASPATFILRSLVALALFGVVSLWAYIAVSQPRFDGADTPTTVPVSRLELVIPLAALSAMFALFLIMQARAFFGGDAYIEETTGLTVAEYARGGFWQLCVVSVLTLLVIAVAAWKAPRRTRADRIVLQSLLGGLCLMSLVVAGSALYRMSVYFEAFGLTRLRLWVFTVELWLVVLFLLVIVCCWRLRATWLPRAFVASGIAALLGLAAINPDGFIAEHNVARYDETGYLDLRYASTLSADALPALAALPEKERECALAWWSERHDEREHLTAWNVGHARAAELAGVAGRPDTVDCLPNLTPDLGIRPEEPIRGDAVGPPTGADPLDPGSDPDLEGAAFFDGPTCDELDISAAIPLFGTSAKPDAEPVLPDRSVQYGAVVSDEPAAGNPQAYLECGFFGAATSYLRVDVTRWTAADAAARHVESERRSEPTFGNLVIEDYSGSAGEGFTYHREGEGNPHFRLMIVVDDLTVSAAIDYRAAQDASEVLDVMGGFVEHEVFGLYEELV